MGGRREEANGFATDTSSRVLDRLGRSNGNSGDLWTMTKDCTLTCCKEQCSQVSVEGRKGLASGGD